MTMEPIRLTVTARDGQERADWPLTRGVTLPEGAAGDAGELILTGPDGAVPVQLRPLARWPDGSFKWVLADFQGRVEGGSTSVYHLQAGGPEAVSPEEAVEISETEEAVVVCAGPLRFSLSRARPGLFDRVETGRRIDGTFQPEADLSGEGGGELWARIREGEFLGGTRRRIYGMGGECLASLAPEEWSVEVEEAGPLRAVVTCRGALEQRAPMHHYTGYRPLRFVVRIHVFAGQPFVRLQHTVVFHLNPRGDAGRRDRPAPAPGRWRRGGSSAGRRPSRSALRPCPPGGELLLAQQEDNHFRQLESGGDGRVSEGERTEGWLTAESGAGGLGLAMRHMAEQHPTALRVSGGGIAAMPWHHPEGRLLSLERYSEEVAWHEGEGGLLRRHRRRPDRGDLRRLVRSRGLGDRGRQPARPAEPAPRRGRPRSPGAVPGHRRVRAGGRRLSRARTACSPASWSGCSGRSASAAGTASSTTATPSWPGTRPAATGASPGAGAGATASGTPATASGSSTCGPATRSGSTSARP